MKTRRVVYLVQHVAREDSPTEDVKRIGIYSSRKLADAIVAKYKKIQGFSKYPDSFYVSAVPINFSSWEDGFITVRHKRAAKQKGARREKLNPSPETHSPR